MVFFVPTLESGQLLLKLKIFIDTDLIGSLGFANRSDSTSNRVWSLGPFFYLGKVIAPYFSIFSLNFK